MSLFYMIKCPNCSPICSPVFVVEDFSGFLAHLSVYSIKDSMSA